MNFQFAEDIKGINGINIRDFNVSYDGENYSSGSQISITIDLMIVEPVTLKESASLRNDSLATHLYWSCQRKNYHSLTSLQLTNVSDKETVWWMRSLRIDRDVFSDADLIRLELVTMEKPSLTEKSIDRFKITPPVLEYEEKPKFKQLEEARAKTAPWAIRKGK
jgi:hypothetical protein